jgi:hypothetical protein
MEDLDIYKCYMHSPFLSKKHSSYFHVYEELLHRFRGREIVFVEIGVLNGGSLFMWREYLGSQARIIGIDLNPEAKRWEADGFEIHIGNQAEPQFWREFFSVIGDVDVVLDDGGHTNAQQVITAYEVIPHIKDGGLLIVEDTHTSYFSSFGNPSKYSFINYTKSLIDSINSRFPKVDVSDNPLNKCVASIAFFESIVCMKVNRSQCVMNSKTSNGGKSLDALDYREHDTHVDRIRNVRRLVGRPFRLLARIPRIRQMTDASFDAIISISSRIASLKLKKYFS